MDKKPSIELLKIRMPIFIDEYSTFIKNPSDFSKKERLNAEIISLQTILHSLRLY